MIGPGSFLTSLMPLLLLDELTQALRRSSASMIYIGNLGRELSPAAAALSLQDKLTIMESKIGRKIIDAVIVSPTIDISGVKTELLSNNHWKQKIFLTAMTASYCVRRWKTPCNS